MRLRLVLCLFLAAIVHVKGASEYRWTAYTTGAVNSTSYIRITDPLYSQSKNLTYTWAVSSHYTRNDKTDVGISLLPISNWTYTVNYTISYFDFAGNPAGSENSSLTISYSGGANSIYSDARLHSLKNFPKAEVHVTSVNSVGTCPVSDLRLELTLIGKESPTSYLATNGPELYINGDASMASWAFVPGMEEYELEWTTIDKYKIRGLITTLPDEPFMFKEPIRVSTNNQWYDLELLYPDAVVYFRVRGVAYYPNGSPYYTAWSYGNSLTNRLIYNLNNSNQPYSEELNWSATTTFAELGRNKQIINFMDGTSKSRQLLTNLNSEAIVLVAETKYDYEGRPVVQVLPTPVTKFKKAYQSNFNVFPHGKKSYDADVTRDYTADPIQFNGNNGTEGLVSSSGASKYYSSANNVETVHKDYIPSANGYPFTQVKYNSDPTGRLASQAGVGNIFHLRPSVSGTAEKRFSQFFSGNTNATEITRLFGTNTGTAFNYKKDLVVDPNGQISVTYKDKNEMVIATALAGANPDNLQKLDSNLPNPSMVVSLIDPNNSGNNTVDKVAGISRSVNTILNVTKGTVYDFSYDLMGIRYALLNNSMCMDCEYTLTVTITGPDGALVKRTNPQTISPTGSGCEPYASSNISFSETFDEIGDYTVVKELKLKEGWISNFLSTIQNNSNYPQFETFLNEQLGLIDETQCDFTCDQKCLTKAFKLNPNWKLNRGNYATQIAAFVNNCKITDCEPIVKKVSDMISKDQIECNSQKGQMREQVIPGGYYNNIDSWLDDLINNKFHIDNFDWGLGGGVTGNYTYPTTKQMLRDPANFDLYPSWKDNMTKYHPEYCQYLACVQNTGSKQFDRDMALIKDWDEAVQRGFTNPLNMSDGGIGIPISSVTVLDPFFSGGNYGDYLNGGFGLSRLNDAMNKMRVFYQESIGANGVIADCDFNNNGNCSDPFSIWQFVSSQYTYRDANGTNPHLPTSTEKWQLFRSAYMGVKTQLEQEIKSNTNCPGAFVAASNDIRVIKNMDFPTNAEQAIAINSNNLSLNCAAICRGNVNHWFAMLTSSGCLSPNDQNFTIKSTLAREKLGNYCTNNCGASNPNGYILSELLLSDLNLQQLQALLSCNLLNSDLVVTNPYHCSSGFENPSGAASNFIKLRKCVDGQINSPNCEDIVVGSNGKVMQLTGYLQQPKAAAVWYKDKIDMSRPFSVLMKVSLGIAGAYNSGADGITFTFQKDPGGFSTIGSIGPGLGIGGRSNAVSVEIDTYDNGVANGDLGLLTDDHIAIDFTANRYNNGVDVIPGDNYGYIYNIGEVEDNNDHFFKVAWSGPPLNKLDVYFDDLLIPKLSYIKSPSDVNILGESDVIWGITAGIRNSNTQKVEVLNIEYPLASCIVDAIVDNCPDMSSMATGCAQDLVAAINTFIDSRNKGVFPVLNCVQIPTVSPQRNVVYSANLFNGNIEQRMYWNTSNSCSNVCPNGQETIVLRDQTNGFLVNWSGSDGLCPSFGCGGNNTQSFLKIQVGSQQINTENIISLSNPYYSVFNGVCPNRNIVQVDVKYLQGGKTFIAKGTLEQNNINGPPMNSFPNCEKLLALSSSIIGCPGSVSGASLGLEMLNLKLSTYGSFQPNQYTYNIMLDGGFLVPNNIFFEGNLQYTLTLLANNATLNSDFQFTLSRTSAGTNDAGPYKLDVLANLYTGTRFNGKEVNLVAFPINGDSPIILASSNLLGGKDPGDCCVKKFSYTFNWEEEKAKCMESKRARAHLIAMNNYTAAVNRYTSALISEHYTKCFSSPFQENFKYTYDNNEYHYTLYYYDQAANLVQTVPPEGVNILGSSAYSAGVYNGITQPNHRMVTTYKYNSLDQLISKFSPDGGESNYWYDRFGRLRLSQNANQAVAINGNYKYSYTKYDEHARVIESGEVQLPHDKNFMNVFTNLNVLLNDEKFPENTITSPTGQVTQMFYDEIAPNSQLAQNNLRNRVSGVSFLPLGTSVQSHTSYSYDVHGNVTAVAQHSPDLGSKVTSYEYELVSGLVKRVQYQTPKDVDYFATKYTYDADARLRFVETSNNGYFWEEDARYIFHKHGPLARLEIGNDKVQGLDYYYTSQGWLKGINTPSLRTPTPTLQQYRVTSDPSNDGINPLTTNQNQWFAQDEYALGLGYHADDYSPIGAVNIGLAENSNLWTGTYPNKSVLGSGNIRPLFNGNIAYTINQMHSLRNSVVPNASADNLASAQLMGYTYDQLNRLISGRSFQLSNGGVWQGRGVRPSSANKYDVDYGYDANGNIMSAKVNDKNGATLYNIEYKYDLISGNKTNNKLKYVSKSPAAASNLDPLMNQLPGNYDYDAIGNMIKDEKEDIQKIEWSAYGKVLEVKRKTGSNKPDLEFIYGPLGHREVKIVKPAGLTKADWNYTYYYYDASGNPMAQYTLESGAPSNVSVEYPIYGSGRIGVYKKNLKRNEIIVNPYEIPAPPVMPVLPPIDYTVYQGDIVINEDNRFSDFYLSDGQSFIIPEGIDYMGYTELNSNSRVLCYGGMKGSILELGPDNIIYVGPKGDFSRINAYYPIKAFIVDGNATFNNVEFAGATDVFVKGNLKVTGNFTMSDQTRLINYGNLNVNGTAIIQGSGAIFNSKSIQITGNVTSNGKSWNNLGGEIKIGGNFNLLSSSLVNYYGQVSVSNDLSLSLNQSITNVGSLWVSRDLSIAGTITNYDKLAVGRDLMNLTSGNIQNYSQLKVSGGVITNNGNISNVNRKSNINANNAFLNLTGSQVTNNGELIAFSFSMNGNAKLNLGPLSKVGTYGFSINNTAGVRINGDNDLYSTISASRMDISGYTNPPFIRGLVYLQIPVINGGGTCATCFDIGVLKYPEVNPATLAIYNEIPIGSCPNDPLTGKAPRKFIGPDEQGFTGDLLGRGFYDACPGMTYDVYNNGKINNIFDDYASSSCHSVYIGKTSAFVGNTLDIYSGSYVFVEGTLKFKSIIIHPGGYLLVNGQVITDELNSNGWLENYGKIQAATLSVTDPQAGVYDGIFINYGKITAGTFNSASYAADNYFQITADQFNMTGEFRMATGSILKVKRYNSDGGFFVSTNEYSTLHITDAVLNYGEDFQGKLNIVSTLPDVIAFITPQIDSPEPIRVNSKNPMLDPPGSVAACEGTTTDVFEPIAQVPRIMGQKSYQLTDHLGNVHVVVTDQKTGVDEDGNGQADYYIANVTTIQDFYPFGAPMVGRSLNGMDYRYGFNGMENNGDELNGSYTTEFRQYDPRLGRWFSMDPLVYEDESPYSFVNNNPIVSTDILGLKSSNPKPKRTPNKKPGKSQGEKPGKIKKEGNDPKKDEPKKAESGGGDSPYEPGKDKPNTEGGGTGQQTPGPITGGTVGGEKNTGYGDKKEPVPYVYGSDKKTETQKFSVLLREFNPSKKVFKLRSDFVSVTFDKGADNPINPKLLNYFDDIMEKASSQGISSVNISSTTNHTSNSKNSAHSKHNGARAFDINYINGEHVSIINNNVSILQKIIQNTPGWRENYGPIIIEKNNGRGSFPAPWAREIKGGHYDHIHVSVPW